jgi:hypothetical protein
MMKNPDFHINTNAGGKVEEINPSHWRLHIPAGPEGAYRLAQFDDYAALKRKDFPWKPPATLQLQGRASAPDLPGTWGFGLWNDPFSIGLGLGGGVRKLPALPQAAWFFFASPPNYLSFRNDLPAVGGLAAAFSSKKIPTLLLGLGAPLLPALVFRPVARLFRWLARLAIGQSAVLISHDPTTWHDYRIVWRAERVSFYVDGQTLLDTAVAPRSPLGLVVWIDNQYAALPPDGKLGWGTLENEDSWIEVRSLEIKHEI